MTSIKKPREIKYTGIFLSDVELQLTETRLSSAWMGNSPMCSDDVAFWTFKLSMICHVLDHLEYKRATEVTSNEIATDDTLASMRDRLSEWLDLRIYIALRALLPSVGGDLDDVCRLVFEKPLYDVIKNFAEELPLGLSCEDSLRDSRRRTVSSMARSYIEQQGNKWPDFGRAELT